MRCLHLINRDMHQKSQIFDAKNVEKSIKNDLINFHILRKPRHETEETEIWPTVLAQAHTEGMCLVQASVMASSLMMSSLITVSSSRRDVDTVTSSLPRRGNDDLFFHRRWKKRRLWKRRTPAKPVLRRSRTRPLVAARKVSFFW